MQRADKRQYHYIYKIVRDDGKYYIGMHSTDDLHDDYFGSGRLISRSIKKYGKRRHSKQILEFLPTREALRFREKELVTEELLDDKLCMNLALGGMGRTSEEAKAIWDIPGMREQISGSQRRAWENAHERRAQTSATTSALWKDPIYRAKLVKSLSGRTVSEENRASISQNAKDRWASMTEEKRAAVIAKISEAGKARGNGWEGRKHSEETKAKMSASAKARPARGPLSAETRAKIAQKARERRRNT